MNVDAHTGHLSHMTARTFPWKLVERCSREWAGLYWLLLIRPHDAVNTPDGLITAESK